MNFAQLKAGVSRVHNHVLTRVFRELELNTGLFNPPGNHKCVTLPVLNDAQFFKPLTMDDDLMINFPNLNDDEFLAQYWQKKHLVIPNAMPDFQNPISPDELAGLALEEDIESRLVIGEKNNWALKTGPFTETVFSTLPSTHWTLLIQGVDRIIPSVNDLLHHFSFIPSWRFDDVMISYATKGGSVGPHYDLYDVFLYQAKGSRKWSLTTEACHENNCVEDTPLRIMKDFKVEHEIIVEEGDMLYLPPQVGHHGVSLSDDCMTYSFGYRRYRTEEMLESFGQFLHEHENAFLYKDPPWTTQKSNSEIDDDDINQLQHAMLDLVRNKQYIKAWLGSYATQLDSQAERLLPDEIEADEFYSLETFIRRIRKVKYVERDPICRMAFIQEKNSTTLFINGVRWDTQGCASEFIQYVANHNRLITSKLMPFLNNPKNQILFFELCRKQFINF